MSTLTLKFKDKVLRVFPLQQGKMTVGSDPSCEIFIDSLAVSPQHAVITTKSNQSILVDNDTEAGTFVNDKKVDTHILEDDEHIRVGKHTLIYTHSDVEAPRNESGAEISLQSVAESTRHKKAWLQILSGQNLGKTISLNKNLTNLGKPGVQTAVIARRNDGFFLSHLEGKNAPAVNDKSIGESTYHLQDGDVIQIGNVKLLFSLE